MNMLDLTKKFLLLTAITVSTSMAMENNEGYNQEKLFDEAQIAF